ncbi:response regulator [Trichocoleus desertorum]|uniref:response regulator n=1 Tax=Trichocoleus desertorum TaxID=1481672 RepID=UPI003D6611D1
MHSPEALTLSQPPQHSRILLVEDEGAIRDTVALPLQAEGFQVVAVEDGREALEWLQYATPKRREGDEPFDLIILDLMLPFISGLDVCRFIRQQSHSTPILILSARTAEADIVMGLGVGLTII